jgi:hypothetical protein
MLAFSLNMLYFSSYKMKTCSLFEPFSSPPSRTNCYWYMSYESYSKAGEELSVFCWLNEIKIATFLKIYTKSVRNVLNAVGILNLCHFLYFL